MRPFLYLTELVAALFALTVGVRRWRHLHAGYRILAVQLAVACLTEIAGQTLRWCGLNNQPLFNVYLLVEMLLLIAAAYCFFSERIGRIFCVSCAVLGTAAWTLFFCFSSILQFSFPLLLFECFLQSAVYLTLLILLISRDEEIIQPRRPELWLITGTLVYFSGNIPLFSILNFMDRRSVNAALVFNLNILLLCLRYIATGVAFCLCRGSRGRLTRPLP